MLARLIPGEDIVSDQGGLQDAVEDAIAITLTECKAILRLNIIH